MEMREGTRVTVSGGYDFEPTWLAGREGVAGAVLKWIPGRNEERACVVLLDEPLTATGDVRGGREERTGSHIVLALRYAGQVWEEEATVHIELCESEPVNAAWSSREAGAWVESHATYRMS
ncbi:hypothetical protein GCM10022415_15910 [Knoellia locipacati]|uniref:Uncharacterized protein n=1 Tax=Knoellia locipacati TaxID=882824 RepID=A0A512T038_9MICO|nr:hypothetical protein [Knoellia locipacati]GEQ13541.1 hypothetical protein KLO01_15880 [Knoellia locipacati]